MLHLIIGLMEKSQTISYSGKIFKSYLFILKKSHLNSFLMFSWTSSKLYRIHQDLSPNKTADFNLTEKYEGLKIDCMPIWVYSSQVLISSTGHFIEEVYQYTIGFNDTCTSNILIEAYGKCKLINGPKASNSTLLCVDKSIQRFIILITSAIIILLLAIFIYFVCPSLQPVN